MIAILALILFVLLLAVGGERGAVSVMALAGNIIVLSLTVLLLASGWPILLVMVPAGIAVSYITLVKQNGKNVKAGAAFLAAGIVMGLLFPAVLLVVTQAGIGGLNEIQAQQEDVMLYYNVNISIRMVQLAVGVNLLSILGAVRDTPLSVTSSMYEVMLHKPEITRAELFGSGIQIGKGITGTTVNTLLFAYLGESILLFSYVIKMSYSFETALNSKFLFQDAAVMLFGAIACLMAVPISSAAAACIYLPGKDR